jgi:hypothetical protein
VAAVSDVWVLQREQVCTTHSPFTFLLRIYYVAGIAGHIKLIKGDFTTNHTIPAALAGLSD